MRYSGIKTALGHLLAVISSVFWLNSYAHADHHNNLELINLPPGFSISLYANVPGARSLAVVPELGGVFVGTRGNSIYLVHDRDLKGKPESVSLFANGLKVPNGIAVKNGLLYVVEQNRIITLPISGEGNKKILLDGLPDERWHGWRYAAFGPNGRLYVSIGAPCNVCRVTGQQGTIIEVDTSLGTSRIYARGIRNSVGMDFHPQSGQLYFTDNGSDGMGDDIPPDELNHAPKAGLHFGFPWYGGGKVKTREMRGFIPPAKLTPPIVEFGAHTASLGIYFYRGRQFPEKFANSAFVAQHGSWNRSIPTGYRVMHLEFNDSGGVLTKKIFADGWLQQGNKWGRPVDIKELPDGSLLVSDDHAGAIYRIVYKP